MITLEELNCKAELATEEILHKMFDKELGDIACAGYVKGYGDGFEAGVEMSRAEYKLAFEQRQKRIEALEAVVDMLDEKVKDLHEQYEKIKRQLN